MLVENSTTADATAAVHCGANNPLLPALLNSAGTTDAKYWYPLVLYGEIGAGKSFVALTIAEHWNRKAPSDAKAIVTTAADLVRLFQPTSLASQLETTTKQYRAATLLIIDDVHQLSARENASSWLVSLMDHRQRYHLPTVVTASSMGALKQLPQMLFSRLTCGLPVLLSLPDARTRELVVDNTLQSTAAKLTAEQRQTLVRETDGLSINGVRNLVLSTLSGTAEAGSESSGEHNDDLPGRCLRATAKRFGIPLADLKGPSRRKNTVLARSVAMFMVREFCGKSLLETGQLFQNRDHTTVRHACRKVKKLLLTDQHVQDSVQSLCISLNLRYDPRWSISTNDKCA